VDRTDLCFTPATELADLIRRRHISPVEPMEAILSRIEDLQPRLNAFITVCAEQALENARQAEADIMGGKPLGPLHGVPFSVKDLLWTEGVRTTFGSRIFESHVPTEDACCVRRLKKAGGILVGKTTTPEFGHKAITDSPLFGTTRNPWNLERTPGGSSGGAAAAVASGLGPLAVGTDGGGSVRIPASCTGTVGLKPTLGRVPHPHAPDLFGNLSHIGPITRTLSDAALMMELMGGPDRQDPCSCRFPKETYLSCLGPEKTESLKGWRIAWSPTLGNTDVDAEVLHLTGRAIKVFEDLGCHVEETGPVFGLLEEPYLVIFHSAFAARLGEHLPRFREKLDPSLVAAIENGSAYGAADLQRALFVRARVFQKVERFFERWDLLITPTLSSPALPVTHSTLDPVIINGKTAGSVRAAWYPYTYPFNMTGHPALSVPCGCTSGHLPVGLQMVGPWLGERALLKAGAAFEKALPWANRRPVLDTRSRD
jgi:aspartyl-tRNA(Asn)/glutamyl-tRNA(Gln) amidotransferase subunit A